MRTLIPAALILLMAACASAPVDDATNRESTTDFDVAIRQVNEPILIPGRNVLDFRYAIEVRNKTADPVTLKRVTLMSVGSGPARINTITRVFDKVIPPQGTETVDFWTTADINDLTPDHRAPLTLRVRPSIRGADGKDRTETFLRQLAAIYRVGNVW